jgi:hypothetical protein
MGCNISTGTFSDEVQLILITVQKDDPTFPVDIEMNKRPET